MSKRSSVTARIVAVVALVCGVAILLFVVGSSLSDNGGDSGHHSKDNQVIQGEKKGANGKAAPSAYVVQNGDTLTSIAREQGTTARSIAFWNRQRYPSLDPDSPRYAPNRIEIGWELLLVPNVELDPEDLPDPSPSETASPSTSPSASPAASG